MVSYGDYLIHWKGGEKNKSVLKNTFEVYKMLILLFLLTIEFSKSIAPFSIIFTLIKVEE